MFFHRKRKTRTELAKKRSANPKIALIRRIVFGCLLFVLIGLCGLALWHGSRVDSLTIKEIEIIGGETIKHEDIEAIVSGELEGTYYKLIPRQFAWFYPKRTMIEKVSAVDRLKNVHIERYGGEKLLVVFEEYQPFALWCNSDFSSECLFMDREGFGFSWAPKLQGGAFLRFSERGREPERFTTGFPGEYIRDTEAFIQKVYDELGMNITHVERTGKEELEYHIAGGGKLKVSRRQTPEETFQNLVTLLTSDAFSHIEPGNFQYIDLRYGNKLFVNEEDPSAATATSTASSTVQSEWWNQCKKPFDQSKGFSAPTNSIKSFEKNRDGKMVRYIEQFSVRFPTSVHP